MKKNFKTSFSKKELTIIKENYGLPYDFYGYLLNNKTESSVKSEFYKLDRNDVISQRNSVLQKLKKDPRIVNLKNDSLIKLINNSGLTMDDSTLYKNDKRNNYSIKSLNILIYSINKHLNGDLYVSDDVLEDFIAVMDDLKGKYSLSVIEQLNGLKEGTLTRVITKQNKLLKTDAIKINAWLGTLNTKEVSEDLFTHADENEAINKLNEFVDSFKNSLNEVKALKDSNIILNKLVDGLKKEIYQLNAGITELENKNDILSKMVDELKEELTIEKEKVSSMLINSETELVSEVESNDDTFHFFKRFLPKK
jgi:hypothetical protein